MNAAKPPAADQFTVLTSPGPAAIAVVRVWGADVPVRIAGLVHARRPLPELASAPGYVGRATLLDAAGAPIDDILLSIHDGPPNWDLRLHLHGNPWLVRHCAERLRQAGLTAAAEAPGPWPARDTLDAEAFDLLPRVLTLRGARWLLWQPGRLRAAVKQWLASGSLDEVRRAARQAAERLKIVAWFTDPLRVVLVGPPNVGKSTLANALADRAVSIVAAEPGTTRDWVEAPSELDGFPVVWLDTAGLRESSDALERASAERTRQLLAAADAVVVVVDAAAGDDGSLAALIRACGESPVAAVALSKCDLAAAVPGRLQATLPPAWASRAVAISAAARTGLTTLGAIVLAATGRDTGCLGLPAAFTERQAESLIRASNKTDYDSVRELVEQVVNASGYARAPLHANGCGPDPANLA